MFSESIVRPARLRVLSAAVCAALVLALAAGCSSSGSSSNNATNIVDKALAATLKGGSGKISGTINGAVGSQPSALNGEWKGDLSGSGSTTAEFRRGQTKIPTQLLWVDKVMYINRSTATLPDTDALAIFTRPAASKPWRAIQLNGGIADAVPSAFSPAALLQWLKRLNVPTKDAGSERVGSVNAKHIVTTRPVVIGIWTGATVDLWLDKSDRVVRVKISNPVGGAQYDVTNYGVEVSVTKPPTDQIETQSETVATKPDGPFTTVKSGTTNGVTWKLERAKGTNDTTCWRWTATPKLAEQTAGPRCLKAPAKDATADDQTEFLVNGNGQGSYDALAVALPPGVKSIQLGRVGGKLESVPVQDSPLVWVGSPSPFPAYLGLTMNNGDIVDCAAGAITTPDDLGDPRATASAETAAWGCLVRVR
jgi:hypothetical protein